MPPPMTDTIKPPPPRRLKTFLHNTDFSSKTHKNSRTWPPLPPKKSPNPLISQQIHAKMVAKIDELHCGQDGSRDRVPFSLNQPRPPSSWSAPNCWPYLILSLPLSLNSFFLVELSLKSYHGLKRSDNNNNKKKDRLMLLTNSLKEK